MTLRNVFAIDDSEAATMFASKKLNPPAPAGNPPFDFGLGIGFSLIVLEDADIFLFKVPRHKHV
jgi:hypothetical protein